MTELHRLSIADAGHRIASGALSPVDLVRAYLDRIEEHDGTLRSYVLVRREEAIQEAEQAAQGHCHVKRSDFDRVFSVACRDANNLLHTPSIST